MKQPRPSKQKILVLGGGFGGLRCALDLSQRIHHDTAEILLVDKKDQQDIHASLYEAAAAKVPQKAICLPLHQIAKTNNIIFVHDVVESLDPVNQQVKLHSAGWVRYDYLVIALGCIPNDYHIPGLSDFGQMFYSFHDALQIRRQVQHLIKRQHNVRLVIGGGGPTGTELAAAFRYYAHDFCHHHGKTEEHLYVDLIEASGQLLSGLPTEMGKTVAKELSGLGVRLFMNNGIKKVTAKQVELTGGTSVPYDILVWTGGIKVLPFIANAQFELDPRGRIVVNPYLQARGFSRVYVVGDTASYSVGKHKTLPQVAYQAIWEGAAVAHNIAKQLRNKSPEKYRLRQFPTVLPLGNKTALLWYKGRVYKGKWVLWLKLLLEFAYLSTIVSPMQAWQMAYGARHQQHELVGRNT